MRAALLFLLFPLAAAAGSLASLVCPLQPDLAFCQQTSRRAERARAEIQRRERHSKRADLDGRVALRQTATAGPATKATMQPAKTTTEVTTTVATTMMTTTTSAMKKANETTTTAMKTTTLPLVVDVKTAVASTSAAGMNTNATKNPIVEIVRPEEDETEADDPECPRLRQEYEKLCFTLPPLLAFAETKAFCDAFVQSCKRTLTTNFFSNIKSVRVDFSAYCRRSRERFEYVCPDPLRFRQYAEEASEFCVRYQDRCPDANVPSEPVQFHDKMEGHIYTREKQFICARDRHFARAYCVNKEVLKLPRYLLRCHLYKINCIDTLTDVIYGK